MKKLVKILPAFGLVLAAAFAFAFTEPVSVNEEPLFGTPDEGITWVRVNDPQNPVNYQCDQGSESCLYTDEDLGSPAGPMDSKFILQ
jgi:hypothetical protein